MIFSCLVAKGLNLRLTNCFFFQMTALHSPLGSLQNVLSSNERVIRTSYLNNLLII
jgi:hypothetical protein